MKEDTSIIKRTLLVGVVVLGIAYFINLLSGVEKWIK